ncbi:hypothetical protein LCGC14_1301290 [marine sediment metagenome]|uniref:Toxin VasX N-terminal region domain-containing protein n=2 Tax=root TaxID=1 RepID=A0A0F9N638_9ZZZZ
MTAQTNPMESYPYPVQGAHCPLLVAVLPLRYAIGPDQGIEAGIPGLPPLRGDFPMLKPDSPPTKTLQYNRRLLRDGWLYLWLEEQQRLVEYRVRSFHFGETDRAGSVIDTRSLPYLIMPAGESAKLTWAPVQWTKPQYDAASQNSGVRQRVMRPFTPGVGPSSHLIRKDLDTLVIGEYHSPDGYKWSCEPDTGSRPEWVRTIFAMNHCEQQAWAVVDDPWGVAMDLAALMRERKTTHESFMAERADDWAMAGVLRSLAKGDAQLASKMTSIADVRRLNQVWHEMDTVEDRFANDMADLSGCWVEWFSTLHREGFATLGTACGHFDIIDPAHRDALEQHLALACLGPAATQQGAMAVQQALAAPTPQKPWMLWALLGVTRRLDAAQLANIIGVADAASETLPETASNAARVAQALLLSASINRGAARLASFSPASAQEPLLASIAPAVALKTRNWPDELDQLGKTYFIAALGRSQQRMEISAATRREVGEWLSEQIGTRTSSAIQASQPAAPATAAVAAIPVFRLVSGSSSSPVPAVGPGSHSPAINPVAAAVGTIPNVGAVAANVTRTEMLDLSRRALQDAPVKSAIAILAGINLVLMTRELAGDRTAMAWVGSFGSLAGTGAAIAAIAEKLWGMDWRRLVRSYGAAHAVSQAKLVNVLTAGMAVQGASAVVSVLNIIVFGGQSMDAYRHGDLDTAALDTGVAAASAGQLVLQAKAFRTYRAARAAVLAGQLAALRTGTAVTGNAAGFVLLSLTSLIVGGVVMRQYTQDTPLERWVANTRFGVNPAAWSHNYHEEMTQLYALLFPISLRLERYPELNPRTGRHVEVTWLILRLQGQNTLTDEMIYFEGQEVWDGGGWFTNGVGQSVTWTARDFEVDAGTRRPRELGVARYRRIYHPDRIKGQLGRVQGQLTYSPVEGFALPPIDISNSSWF